MSGFRRGEILNAFIPDPDNNYLEDEHPCIFVEDSHKPNRLLVIGITGSFDEPINPLWYKMPYDDTRPGGHSTTGLTKECVAKANWYVEVAAGLIRGRRGRVDDDDLAEI